MAVQHQQASQQIDPYLSPNQQGLLLAALNSQANSNRDNDPTNGNPVRQRSSTNPVPQQASMANMNANGLFMSPSQAELGNLNGDFTPDFDYLDGEGFDFEDADLGGEMIGALPGSNGEDDFSNGHDLHEKRKNSDEGNDGDEGDAKRQEGEKGAKKPGRKPLTSEPTTKRKAQNRAAQRAFRERKEQHLKDLETKVTELTKAQEADKHENGMLKAQVERLNVELREYRKRLSLNGGSGANRSPPMTAYGSQTRNNSNPAAYGNNFQFDFPKFGGLPGSQIFGNALAGGSDPSLGGQRSSVTPPITQSPTRGSFSGPPSQLGQGSRQNSMGRSISPQSVSGTNTGSPSQMTNVNPNFAPYSTNDNMHGFASTLPQMSGVTNDPFGDLFSPSILKSASMDSTGGYLPNTTQANGSTNINDVYGGDSTAGLNRVFQFNSNSSNSDSGASPSASSASQWNANANSSTGTSPEPSGDSPANKSRSVDSINPAKSQSPLVNETQNFTNTNNQFGNIDYSMPSVNTFDPVLFDNYRDSHDAIIGGGNFTGGFFDEALNTAPFDFGSPSNLFGILQSPEQSNALLNANTGAVNAPTPSASLMAEIEKTRDGGDDDYGLPAKEPEKPKPKPKTDMKGNLISCNNIWNQLQSNPDFQAGTFDLDGLCSELRAKARCSESGVMVDQDHVDAALRKLGKKDETGNPFAVPSHLMFEQESWDNVLRKMNSNKS